MQHFKCKNMSRKEVTLIGVLKSLKFIVTIDKELRKPGSGQNYFASHAYNDMRPSYITRDEIQ